MAGTKHGHDTERDTDLTQAWHGRDTAMTQEWHGHSIDINLPWHVHKHNLSTSEARGRRPSGPLPASTDRRATPQLRSGQP